MKFLMNLHFTIKVSEVLTCETLSLVAYCKTSGGHLWAHRLVLLVRLHANLCGFLEHGI